MVTVGARGVGEAGMRILLLVRGDVSGWYAASLMERGCEVTIHGGGAIQTELIMRYSGCDGCLLLGNDEDLLEIADYMETLGNPIWRNLADIPKPKGGGRRAAL